MDSGGLRAAFKTFREMMPGKAAHSVAVRDDNGDSATTPLKIRAAWQRFFIAKVGGFTSSMQDLSSACHARQRDSSPEYTASEVPVEFVPAVVDIAKLLYAGATGKGHGEDSVPYEFFRVAIWHMAHLLHPLFLKCIFRLEHPLPWKGGMLAELFKNKGSPGEQSNYRGVLVSDSAGKYLDSWTRHRLLDSTSGAFRPNQCGGTKHLGTDFCAHISALFYEYLAQSRMSGAQLFIDVSSAFESVIRSLLYDDGYFDYHVATALEGLGYGPDVIHDMARHITDSTICKLQAVHPRLESLLREVHSDAWHSTKGIEDITCSHVGSRAGNPFGDVCFNLICARVVGEVESQCALEGLVCSLPVAAPMGRDTGTSSLPLLDDIYADDAIFFIPALIAMYALQMLAAIATIANDVFASNGLRLNYAANKTEAEISQRGPGSQAAVAGLVVVDAGVVQLPLKHGSATLRVVREYTHMGMRRNAHRSLVSETQARSTQTFKEFTRIRAKIIECKQLSRNTKLQLGNVFMFLRLYYNSGTWNRVSPRVLRPINRTYMAVLRSVAGMKNVPDADKISDAAVH